MKPADIAMVNAKGVGAIVAAILDEYVPPDTPTGDTLGMIAQENAVQLRALHGIPEPTRRTEHEPLRFARDEHGASIGEEAG